MDKKMSNEEMVKEAVEEAKKAAEAEAKEQEAKGQEPEETEATEEEAVGKETNSEESIIYYIAMKKCCMIGYVILMVLKTNLKK